MPPYSWHFSLKFSFRLNKHCICLQHLQKDFHLTWRAAHRIPFVGWHNGGGYPAFLVGKVKFFAFTSGSLGGKLSSGNLTYSLLWPLPLQLEKCQAWKKKTKDIILRRWETQEPPWKPLVGACMPSMRFDSISPLPFSLPPALLCWKDSILLQNTKLWNFRN